MAERATNKDLNDAAKMVNGHLEGTGNMVIVNGRYGYTAVDLAHEGKPWTVRKTLRTSMTKGEALQYLWALETGMELVASRKVHKVI